MAKKVTRKVEEALTIENELMKFVGDPNLDKLTVDKANGKYYIRVEYIHEDKYLEYEV